MLFQNSELVDPEYLKKLAVRKSFIFSFLRPPKLPELPSQKEEEVKKKEMLTVLYCCDYASHFTVHFYFLSSVTLLTNENSPHLFVSSFSLFYPSAYDIVPQLTDIMSLADQSVFATFRNDVYRRVRRNRVLPIENR